MKLDYPVIVSKEKNDYIAYVPDLDIDTYGKTFDEALDMAYDAIGLVYMVREDKKLKIKRPSKIDIFHKDKRYKNDIVTHVTIDPLLYRQNNDNISVRRNVTLPSWLDKIVRQNKINVSEFLQNMLRRELRV